MIDFSTVFHFKWRSKNYYAWWVLSLYESLIFFLGSLCDFCLKMYKNQENYHFQKLSCYDDNATLTIFVLNIFPSRPCSLKLKLLNKNDIKSIGLMNILILQWSSLNCLPVFRTVNIKNIHVWYIYFCRTFHIFYCRFSII